MKLNTKAETVEGILSPIAISKAIINQEIPKKRTWKRIGIQAYQSDANISQICGGNFHQSIIIISTKIAIKQRIKKKTLKMKLIACNAFEED